MEITENASEFIELFTKEIKTSGNLKEGLPDIELTPWDKVKLARSPERIKTKDLLDRLFTEKVVLSGDRCFGDDRSIYAGIAMFHDIPVTFLGICKGKNLEENLAGNFGMPNPEGYRKCIRLMEEAEKFKRPIITILDTPGANPRKEAEERGQGMAVAQCISKILSVKVPTVSLIIGEAGSGGALALTSTDRILMMENAVFSILSPEGFASILWKDKNRAVEAAGLMKLTAGELKGFGIIDEVIPERKEFTGNNLINYRWEIDGVLYRNLKELMNQPEVERMDERYRKFDSVGLL